MTRFIIFVTLLGVQFACSERAKEVVKIVAPTHHAYLEVKPTGTPYKCKVETNENVVHEYEPGNRSIAKRIMAFDNSGRKTCAIRIDGVRMTDAGKWKITAYINDNNQSGKEENYSADERSEEFPFRVYVVKEVSVSPLPDLTVYSGYYVNVQLGNRIENITACEATTPQNRTIDLFAENDDFKLFGQCGFRALANASFNGEWKIAGYVGDYAIYYGKVSLTSPAEEVKPSEMEVLELEIGDKASINVGPKVIFCQLVDPSGIELPTSYGGCTHTIRTVTRYHEGIWMARYAVLGKLDMIDMPFRIVTHEKHTFKGQVTVMENGNIDLKCHIKVPDSGRLKYCEFIRPDGVRLSLSAGVGTKQYSAYGNELSKTFKRDGICGIIINEPSFYDYGAWRCHLGLQYESYGTILKVDPLMTNSSDYETNVCSDNVNVRAPDVYVKRGDSFKIKCVADAPLNYCWLRNPNGTAYSVSPTNKFQSAFTLRYEGAGLALGECGAIIANALDSDHGQWTCHLGLRNSTEKAQAVSVIVTESYLIAEQDQVIASKGDAPVLTCNIIPSDVDRTVHYCRWIRPDGYGIYNGVSHRYTASSNASACRLVILNYNPRDDIGRWTCVAGVSLPQVEEVWASVTLRKGAMHFGTLAGFVMGACIVLTVTGCAFLLINIRRRRRLLPKDPPAYSPEPYQLPRSLQPNYASKEFQY
ncbi:hypothetical protein KM043_012612 [Ampulex compressa]|nr:hypothetical protein KM043_012612 [Ampulex compressa]